MNTVSKLHWFVEIVKSTVSAKDQLSYRRELQNPAFLNLQAPLYLFIITPFILENSLRLHIVLLLRVGEESCWQR